jgi:hypothetical protein
MSTGHLPNRAIAAAKRSSSNATVVNAKPFLVGCITNTCLRRAALDLNFCGPQRVLQIEPSREAGIANFLRVEFAGAHSSVYAETSSRHPVELYFAGDILGTTSGVFFALFLLNQKVTADRR